MDSPPKRQPSARLPGAILFVLLALSGAAHAAEVTDATNRTVTIPDHIAPVLPAGPPAAVLVAAIAPTQTLGFASPVSPEARAVLPPPAADLPQVPRLTTSADPAAIGKLHPDLIIDYDTVSPRYHVIILADPAAPHVLTRPAWASLRAVREGHAYAAPACAFGWIEEPPSVNRLVGLAWLRGADPLTLAALLNAGLYGRALTTPQLQSIAGTTPAIKP